jgi:ubiquinone/menaquinone biosynthesis C-methylase UbiE
MLSATTQQTAHPTPLYLASVINTELQAMHTVHPHFAGVYAPVSEMGKTREGVSDAFLKDADAYFERFKQFEYTANNLKRVFDAARIQPNGTILDMGAGFGNSTIPLLKNHPDVHIIAADISPNLLAILGNLAKRYNVHDRVDLIACDLLNDYFKPNSVNMVLGVAILHHLVDPMALIRSILKSLKSSGIAFFMEPFAEGHLLLKSLMQSILVRYTKEALFSPWKIRLRHIKALYCLYSVCMEIDMRTTRDASSKWRHQWRDKDDKWLFTREYFMNAAEEVGAEVEFVNLHQSDTPILNQFTYLLREIAKVPIPQCLPAWAWEMAGNFDRTYVTPAMRESMFIEAAIIIRRP